MTCDERGQKAVGSAKGGKIEKISFIAPPRLIIMTTMSTQKGPPTGTGATKPRQADVTVGRWTYRD